MSANTLFVLPTGDNEIKFSLIRDMYDRGNGDQNGFRKFYRDGDIVGSSTYHTDYDPLENPAQNIPDTGELKMSQFRGAYKEHIITINGDIRGPYSLTTNGGINTSEKRTYRVRVIGNIYHNTQGDYIGWDSNGNGNPGILVDVPESNTRVIIHVTKDANLGGGPGKAGTGGNGGLGGVSGTPGSGSTIQGQAGGDADDTFSRPGGDGVNGTSGGNGGHCIYVTDYPTDQTLYIHGYRDASNNLTGFY